jgi:iron complex outermembrane receptor protein
VGAGLGLSVVAAAADQTPAANDATLEEIVITAEKRESTVQHTALDVEVFSGSQMHDRGVEDFSTLSKIAPNVSVTTGNTGGIGATSVAIDGIQAYNLSNGAQSPIAVNLDGVYLPRMTGLTGYFFDLQRVEVLDGPQGTLYGRNAAGGAINIITNKPTNEFGATGEAEAGNYHEERFEGDLNLPVTEDFALRFAARQYGHDGYFTNGLSDAHQQAARLSGLLHMGSKATLEGSVDYENSNDADIGLGLIGVRNLPATISPTGVVTLHPGPNVAVSSDPYDSTSVLYPYGRGNSVNMSKNWGAQLQFTYDLDWATLYAQSGVRKTEAYAAFLEPPSPLFAAPGVPGAAGDQDFPAASLSYSSEVRLASTSTMPLQWVIGAYNFSESETGEICVQSTYTNPACVFSSGPQNRALSYALFGQVIYTPPFDDNKLHLVGGGRYNYDAVTSNTFESAGFFHLEGITPYNEWLHHVAQKGTYKAGINYDLTPDNLLYFSNSIGYRAFNFEYGSNPYVPSETVKNFDVGSKNEFFDKRLQVNLDAFVDHYYGQDLSEQTYPPPQFPFLPFGEITAFATGETRYEGGSLELTAAVTPRDRISAAIHYVQATYIDFILPPIYKNTAPLNMLGVPTGQTNGDFDGDPIYGVAPWTGTGSYEHRWSAPGGQVTGEVDLQYASRTHMALADPGTIEDVVRAAYVKADVQLRYAPNSDAWSVTLWGRNLADRFTPSSAIYSGTALNGLVTATLDPPRTYGITLRVRVGGG